MFDCHDTPGALCCPGRSATPQVAMRLGPFAARVGFLIAVYALGVVTARHDARPAVPGGWPVAASPPGAPPAVPVQATPELGLRHAMAAELPRAEAPAWSKVAAMAQQGTVAVRADQSYGAGVAVEKA